MELKRIEQIPRGAAKDGFTSEVFTPGFGYYYIEAFVKGGRRYFELRGYYTGRQYFSTGIKDDRAEALGMIKEIADKLVARPINQK